MDTKIEKSVRQLVHLSYSPPTKLEFVSEGYELKVRVYATLDSNSGRSISRWGMWHTVRTLPVEVTRSEIIHDGCVRVTYSDGWSAVIRASGFVLIVSDCKWTEDPLAQKFVDSFRALSNRIHQWAREKGFWEDGTDRNDGEMIALMHSELSEALEALRKGNPPDDKLPRFKGTEAELADVIIRIMDTASQRGWRVAEALIAKMEYNEGRPHKHGKEF